MDEVYLPIALRLEVDRQMTAIDQSFIDEMRAKVEAARRVIKIEDTVRQLQRCALGQVNMTKEQIKAAEILLKKALPDLRELEVKGEVQHKHSLEDLVNASMQPQPVGGVTPTLHQRVEH
jgi:hypothetical protein